MATYAEKADIAAKAVKVLESVTMSRHKASAKQYAYLARKHLLKCKDEHGSGVFYGFTIKASPAIEQINKAVESMVKRLDKPRYTLKDGEWAKKQTGEPLQWLTSKEAKIVRDAQIASMAYDSRMGNAPLGSVSSDEHRAAQRRRNLEMAEKAERMAAQSSNIGQNSMLGAPEPSGAITMLNR